MKKLMIMAVAVMAMATSYAATTWAYLDTVGVNNETTSDVANYSAYYCTAGVAASIFGGASSQEAISNYLAANYVDYRAGIDRMDTMIPYGEGFDDGVYTFVPRMQGGSMTSGDSYIAIVAYLGDGGDKFRVFESSVIEDGSLTFDPTIGSEGGTAGSWTAAAIPEPTTGVLMLFGLACLALRRRA